jgi:predicted transcriptional regulator
MNIVLRLFLNYYISFHSISDASQRDPFVPIAKNESLSYLISNFLSFAIHRAPIEDNAEIVGIVTQSDIIRFLHLNEAKFNSLVHNKRKLDVF